MKAIDIYNSNVCAVNEVEEDGMVFPYFVAVYNGMVISSANHTLKFMTLEEFEEDNKDLDFRVTKNYSNLEDFKSDWEITDEEIASVHNTRTNAIVKQLFKRFSEIAKGKTPIEMTELLEPGWKISRLSDYRIVVKIKMFDLEFLASVTKGLSDHISIMY